MVRHVGTSILDPHYVLFLFKVFEEIAEKVSDRVIDAEAVQSQRHD